MSLTKQKKHELVKSFQRGKADTGSPEVQIALLTERINTLTEHAKANKNDQHTRYGLIRMVSDRKRLIKYLKNNSQERYEKILEKLDLRK